MTKTGSTARSQKSAAETAPQIVRGNMDDNKEYAFHCTDIDPQQIVNDGFKSTGNGLTRANRVERFYKEFLPVNPMFVSSLNASCLDNDSKFCMKIDITGLEKFPDFGRLLDYGAYLDEECFRWEDEDTLQRWRLFGDPVQKKLAEFVLSDCDKRTIAATDFTGEMSYDILGTCAIDGSKLTFDRIAAVRSTAGSYVLIKQDI